MPDDFTSARCLPWLTSRTDVRTAGDPEPVAPGVTVVRGRLRLPWAGRLKFAGFASLVASLLVLMAAARPPRAADQPQDGAVVRTTGLGLGGFALGALALGRRVDRGAPGVSILCMAAGADRREQDLAALAADARARMSAGAYPEGHVWMVSETELPAASQARARELGVRVFFTDRAGRIVEA